MLNNAIKTVAVAALLSTAPVAPALAFTIDFDGVASGATANSAAPAGVSFVEAELVTQTDEFGDEIPGSERWQPASFGAADVLVQNPDTFAGGFYGPAPSGTNALDARSAPVLMQFAGGIDLAGFSVTLDNSSFGNLTPSVFLFLDAAGSILATLDSDQTVPGFIASLNTPLSDVSSILLPSGALYDNLNVSAVPVPPSFSLLFSAVGALGFFARRKRST